jgi:predicted amidohydrolase YtcJ
MTAPNLRDPRPRFRFVIAGLAAIGLLTTSACGEKPQADTLYVGSHIITMDEALGEVDAVAVRGEEIVWVGKRTDWAGTAETVVELGERALLPGFIDAHGHLTFLARTVALANVASPPVGPVTTLASLQDVLRGYIAERGIPPGEWVLGMGYDDSLIAEGRHPDRDDLDAVSREHPIALIHVSGHLATTNSLALERAGITAATPDPPGGVIRRRADGEPDGVLEETATEPLRAFYMGDEGIPAADIDRALSEYARHGITTVQDGATSWETYRLLAEIAGAEGGSQGEGDGAGAVTGLKLDVVIYPVGMSPDFAVPADVGPDLGGYRNRLKVGGVKLVLDGSPQGKTAYLSEPYHVVLEGQPDDYRGYPTIPQPAVNALVARYLGRGIPLLVHCNGDAAAQMLIDAVAAAAETAPLGDHRTVMIHAQTVREDQLDRMKTLGIVPSFFSAHVFYWGDWHRDSVLGPQRAARISPTADARARGLRFTLHNDAPIVPPDMIRLLWATTHRETRSGAILGPEQRIPTLDALRAITLDAAHQSFEEDRKGSLTPGKQADLVILSRDPLSLPASRLLELEVVATIARGERVYTADGTGL